jgi:hypothetical protein
MTAPDNLIGAENLDHAGRFPPAAEVDDVAEVAAAPGAQRGLRIRAFAEMLDKLGRVREGGATGEDLVVQGRPPVS